MGLLRDCENRLRNRWSTTQLYLQKLENDKNRGGVKVLTQGDKLNIIKAQKQLQQHKEPELKAEKAEAGGRRQERITDYHRQTKVGSRVQTKPNILTKRDSVTSR